MMHYIYTLLLLLVIFIQPACAQVEQETLKTTETSDTIQTYKVIGVKDGDTFVVLMDGKEQIVRFAHIDCPEKSQPFGAVAKKFVSDHCFGTYVSLIHTNEYDRYKRLIAEVVLENGENLNMELVKNGLAWHYKKYSKELEYATLEEEARKEKVGLWSLADPIAPWEWRKKKKE